MRVFIGMKLTDDWTYNDLLTDKELRKEFDEMIAKNIKIVKGSICLFDIELPQYMTEKFIAEGTWVLSGTTK